MLLDPPAEVRTSGRVKSSGLGNLGSWSGLCISQIAAALLGFYTAPQSSPGFTEGASKGKIASKLQHCGWKWPFVMVVQVSITEEIQIATSCRQAKVCRTIASTVYAMQLSVRTQSFVYSCIQASQAAVQHCVALLWSVRPFNFCHQGARAKGTCSHQRFCCFALASWLPPAVLQCNLLNTFTERRCTEFIIIQRANYAV